MQKFILLYNGPPPPPGHAHEGWPEWFARHEENVVDVGSPMKGGIALRGDGSTTEASSLRGFGIVQAEDRDEALRLIEDHPLLSVSDDYAIEVFEVPRK